MYHYEIHIARTASRKASEIALKYWNRGVTADIKSDDSPVTIADREAERAIAQILTEAFPDDGLLGEEGAEKPSRSGRRWIIDPIDGTRDFLRGNPAWGTLIGLEQGDDVIVGVAHLAAMGDVYTASRGGGAFCNDSPIRVSQVETVGQAVLCVNGFNSVSQCPFADGLLDWMKPFWAVRSMGGCLDAMMVARGQADLWLEQSGKPWDFAPLKVIAEEAGGRFFSFDGGNGIYGGNCVISTPGLEAEARRLVGAGK